MSRLDLIDLGGVVGQTALDSIEWDEDATHQLDEP